MSDTSMLSRPPEMPEFESMQPMSRTISIERLSVAAEIAWGPRWAAHLAAALSGAAGRPVAATQVHQWSSAARPVPVWVAEALPKVLRERAEELKRQAIATFRQSKMLEAEMIQALPPEPDPDHEMDAEQELDGPGPMPGM